MEKITEKMELKEACICTLIAKGFSLPPCPVHDKSIFGKIFRFIDNLLGK
jgi:hypothetical protein